MDSASRCEPWSGPLFSPAGSSRCSLGHPSHLLLRSLGGVVLVIAAFVVVVRSLVARGGTRPRGRAPGQGPCRGAGEHGDAGSRLGAPDPCARSSGERTTHNRWRKLARAQERELRSWLFSGEVPGSAEREDSTIGAGVQRIQREVEAAHEITVEVVTVGDCELDDNLRELLAAAREATVNSAKWSGAEVVSLFAEVEPRDVSVFVRDRGKGFDPAAVAPDRKGVSESVYGRMNRHGGTADVKSAHGRRNRRRVEDAQDCAPQGPQGRSAVSDRGPGHGDRPAEGVSRRRPRALPCRRRNELGAECDDRGRG